MEKVITVDISKSKFLRANPQWQYNHGQKLQFVGVELPPYYEVHFSNSIHGEAKKQLGDSSGVLIPFEYFQPGKSIYAWIYTTDNDSGITQRQVEIPIHKKAICTDEEPTPEQSDIIEEAIGALNSALDEVDDRIEAALDSAKQSGEFDGTDGTTIWTTSQAPSYPNYTFIIADLVGTPGAVPKEKDLIFYDLKYYKIINVGETNVLSSLYADVKDNNVLHKTGDEMLGALSMGANKITNLANGTNNYDAVNLRQVKQMIADEGSTYRGSFNTKAALLAAPWQNVDKELPYYVDNKDFAIVQADESNNNECWRYIYTTGTGWGEQYKINDAPLSQTQIDALNSGITAVKVQKLDTVEPSAEVNIIEEVRKMNPITQQWVPLPIINKGVNLPNFEIPDEIYHTNFTITINEDELVVEPTDFPTYLLNQMESGRWVIGIVNYNGSIYYATVVEAIERPLHVRLICVIGNGEFLNIENEELGWKASIFTAVSDSLFEELGQAVGEFSEELYNVEEFIGNPSDLNTTDKSSIVNAINEVEAEKIEVEYFDFTWDGDHNPIPAAGVTSTQIKAAVQDGKLVFARVTIGSEVYPTIFSLTVCYDTYIRFNAFESHVIFDQLSCSILPSGLDDNSYIDSWSMSYSVLPDASNNTPQNLGVASPGLSERFSRADHVHAMPSAADVGADPTALIVTFTSNLGGTIIADHTYTEIGEAVSAGKRVIAVLDGFEYQLFSARTNLYEPIVFSGASGTYAHTISIAYGDVITTGTPTIGTYSKPTGGIPKTDLASAVQTSLGKADTALQPGDVAEPFFVTYSTSNGTTWTCDKTFAQITAAMAAGKDISVSVMVGADRVAQTCEITLQTDGGTHIELWVRASRITWNVAKHYSDETISVTNDGLTYADVDAVAADQGAVNANKVLTVNSSGIVVPEDNRFVVTLTPTAQDFSGVMDKTCTEITAAYEAGKDIWLEVDATAMGYDLWRVKATIEAKVSGENYGQVMGFLINLQLTPPSMIFIFTEFNTSGDENRYTTQIYPLATGQWTGGSY